ncbi:MAG: VacJ family lipoprotein [Alphaproteobacteria bacterium]|nr:VacJ family lipoprotein [Alphaproteobacteria bacterium]
MILIRFLLVAGFAALSTACATSPDALEAGDPFEPVNRAVFQFNDAADRAILGPAARTYAQVTPQPAQRGVRNVFNNLNRPVVLANTLLQGDFERSSDVLLSFITDTTFGIGGLFALAEANGVPQHNEDFGQTLAVWGLGDGPYLMLPLLGPSNLRDGAGRFVDRYPHPFNWNEDFSQSGEAWALRGLNGLRFRADAENAFATLDRTAIDPYVQMRSAYRQLRAEQIRDRSGDDDAAFDDLPDFD